MDGGAPGRHGGRLDYYQLIFERAPDPTFVVDPGGRIDRANDQAARVFGYGAGELVGLSVEDVIPERFRARHVAHRAAFWSGPRLRPMGQGLKLAARRKDGSEFPADIMLSPIATAHGQLVLVVVRDVTERQLAEQRLLDSLREKEALLKEIHHRVKNNLAVMSSLFYLESRHTQDATTLKILQESQDRVRAMAMVHEALYQTDSLAAVDFAEYARSLCDRLLGTYRTEGVAVRLSSALEPVQVTVEQAIPLGLILNEMMTNALKHAFAGRRAGEVRLQLERVSPSGCELSLLDDGVGAPGGAGESSGFGLRLIHLLARQLGGEFELVPLARGTQARLRVPALTPAVTVDVA
ncbi:MAG: PAS domain S-box protein [Proteobacteria bacterium]|nr:PAS domain S-box protein [Pseudomonadota bacterium]